MAGSVQLYTAGLGHWRLLANLPINALSGALISSGQTFISAGQCYPGSAPGEPSGTDFPFVSSGRTVLRIITGTREGRIDWR